MGLWGVRRQNKAVRSAVLVSTSDLWDVQGSSKSQRWHLPVDFRLLLPVLEDEGPCSKALAEHFLFFSLLAKASK